MTDHDKEGFWRRVIRDWEENSLPRVLGRRLRAWRARLPSDPWPAELDEQVRRHEAVPVCHHCFRPQEEATWFCRDCGAVAGPYNNLMPYIRIFSIGEVFRSGVGPEARFTPLTTTGYILIGLSHWGYLAPLYYLRLFLNFRKLRRASRRPSGPGADI